jgi:hypothetical protein
LLETRWRRRYLRFVSQTEKQTSCSRRDVTSKDIIYANRYIKFASKYLIFASKDMPLDDPNIEPGDSKML